VLRFHRSKSVGFIVLGASRSPLQRKLAYVFATGKLRGKKVKKKVKKKKKKKPKLEYALP